MHPFQSKYRFNALESNETKEEDTMYKNWKAISAIPDDLFQLAVSMLDLENSGFANTVISGFPQFFQSEPDMEGPVPLSTILMQAEHNGRERSGANFSRTSARRLPFSNEAIPKEVPIVAFLERRDPYDIEWDLIPDEIQLQFDQRARAEGTGPETIWMPGVGDYFDFHGKGLICLETWAMAGIYYIFAPAERILVDIDLVQERAMLAKEDLAAKEANRIARSGASQHFCERDADWWRTVFPTLSAENQLSELEKVNRSSCVMCRRNYFVGTSQ